MKTPQALEIEEKYNVESMTEAMELCRTKLIAGYDKVRIWLVANRRYELTCHKTDAPVEEAYSNSTT